MAIKSGKLINEPRNKELHTLHPLPTFCIPVLCPHGCVAMRNMFQNIHFKRKGTLTQSKIMYLKTYISKESDVNPIYLSQHMFKNIQFKRK